MACCAVTRMSIESDRQIDLIAERIDIAVRVGAPRRASQITRRLGTSAQWVVASADYLARHPPIGPDLQSLSAHRAVLRIQGGAVLDFREVLPEPARSAMPVGFISDDMAATADATGRPAVATSSVSQKGQCWLSRRTWRRQPEHWT